MPILRKLRDFLLLPYITHLRKRASQMEEQRDDYLSREWIAQKEVLKLKRELRNAQQALELVDKI